jgi:hypothetical protein
VESPRRQERSGARAPGGKSQNIEISVLIFRNPRANPVFRNGMRTREKRKNSPPPSNKHSGMSVASSLIFSLMLSRRRRSTALWLSRRRRRFSCARREALDSGEGVSERAQRGRKKASERVGGE